MNGIDGSIGGISLDLFGTLVTVEQPSDPAEAVATELRARGVSVPADWETAFATPQDTSPTGVAVSLTDHVLSVLARGAESHPRATARSDVEGAIRDAFHSPVRTRPGAEQAVSALGDRWPIGVLSNCAVETLALDILDRSSIDETAFEAVVTSVGCGWRKPDTRAFETVAAELGIAVEALLHVGDDPETDGGASGAGAHWLSIEDCSLEALPQRVERWSA